MSLFTEHIAKYKDTVLPQDYLIHKVITGKHFIDRNYHEPISLADLSKASLTSKYHFIRLFRKVYGRTPNQCLVEVRIAHSKTLLRSGSGVSDACLAVGFYSVTSFTSLFKKITGTTPGQFIRNHQSR